MTTTLGEVASQIRSKNAGPFWLTIDVFFDSDDAYERAIRSSITDVATIAAIYSADPTTVRVFLLPHVGAVKISMPRSEVQGSATERDMHAGQQFVPLLALPVT